MPFESGPSAARSHDAGRAIEEGPARLARLRSELADLENRLEALGPRPEAPYPIDPEDGQEERAELQPWVKLELAIAVKQFEMAQLGERTKEAKRPLT